jgi:hypothetical protein
LGLQSGLLPSCFPTKMATQLLLRKLIQSNQHKRKCAEEFNLCLHKEFYSYMQMSPLQSIRLRVIAHITVVSRCNTVLRPVLQSQRLSPLRQRRCDVECNDAYRPGTLQNKFSAWKSRFERRHASCVVKARW